MLLLATQMKIDKQGFTLLETLIATAVVAVLAAIAIPSYNYYINRTEVSEGFRLMDAQRANIDKIQKNKSCTLVDGVADTYKGKYGILTVSGTYTPSTGLSCPSGCNAVYTLNTNGLSKDIAGKVVAAQILNNGKLSKTVSATTVPDKYLPTEFKTISAAAGDVCSKITDDPLVPTDGSLPTGTEDGGEEPTPPTPPTPDPGDKDDNEPDGVDETLTPPTGKPDIVIDPDKKPDGGVCENKYAVDGDETVISIGNSGYYRQESAYYIRDSISLYNTFVKSAGRNPKYGEKIKFVTTCSVAFVSKSQSVPSMFVGNWPSSVQISLVNFGAILGRGGDAQDVVMFNNAWSYRPKTGTGSAPGDALYNYSVATLNITNHGVIAGGGSAGAEAISGNRGGSTRAGGGAPYGVGGKSYLENGDRWFPSRYGVKDGGDASFSGGGGAGVYHDIYSGRGGAWGEVGTRANNNTFVHPAGHVYTGNVLITNTGSGYTKGN